MVQVVVLVVVIVVVVVVVLMMMMDGSPSRRESEYANEFQLITQKRISIKRRTKKEILLSFLLEINNLSSRLV